MKSLRLATTVASVGLLTLFACSSSDTVVAVNVQGGSSVGFVSKLHIKITQGGSQVEQDFTMVPTKEITVDSDGAGGDPPTKDNVFVDSVFERITLPDSFKDGKASVDVEAFDKAGASYFHPAAVDFDVREEGATAVFVKLQPPPPAMGGAGGTGGAASGGTGSGGTTGGSSSGGKSDGGANEGGAGGAR